ncbi:MAG: hypothetical protein ACNYPE_15440 [Candidatus Azotimanducaceae bacterium WSBS_2022_MAG_OTU7]
MSTGTQTSVEVKLLLWSDRRWGDVDVAGVLEHAAEDATQTVTGRRVEFSRVIEALCNAWQKMARLY